MARGWESKSVESQIEEPEEQRKHRRAGYLTPEQLEIERKRDSLLLQRKRVLHDIEICSGTGKHHESRRKMLRTTLEFLENSLNELGWKK